MAERISDRIFWAEADDDALRIENRHAARSALLAYLLLRKQVVVHPAYIWQSADAHENIIGGKNQLLRPPNLHLILGDSPDVENYILDRKAKLEREARIRSTTDIPELHQYARHGDRLISDSAHLDERFTAENAVHGISWSRDDRFRQAVRRDLKKRTFTGETLYGLIFRNRGQYPDYKFDDLIKKLVDRTITKRMLCSVDSLMGLLVNEGLDPRTLGPVFDRLHILHWESHHGPGLRVPLLSRLLDGVLDPYDPNVFWTSMEYLIGKDMQRTLLKLPWADACGIVADLSSHGEWIDFIGTYESIVATVKSDGDEIEEELIHAKIDQAYPTLFQTLRRDGRPGKFAILSVVCGILGFSAGVTSIGALGVVGSLGDITKRWVGIIRRYLTDGERHSVKTYIHSSLRRAAKRRSGDEA